MDGRRIVLLILGYFAFLAPLAFSYWTVFELLRDTTSAYGDVESMSETNDTKSTSTLCLPDQCTNGNPLLFTGLQVAGDDDDDEFTVNSVTQQKALGTLGFHLAGEGHEDVIMLYVTMHMNRTVEPGYCSNAENDTDEGLRHFLALAYVKNSSLLSTQTASQRWLSLGLLDGAVNRYTKKHPLRLTLSDEDCWNSATRQQKKALLHYKVRQIASDLALYHLRQKLTNEYELPGSLLIRDMDVDWEASRIGSWVLPYVSKKHTYSFESCQAYNSIEAVNDLRLRVHCENPSTDLTRCLQWRNVATSSLAVTIFRPELHMLWLWLVLAFLVPAALSWLLDGSIRFAYESTDDECVTTEFRSLDVLRHAPPVDGVGFSFPAQLQPATILFRQPKAQLPDSSEGRESRWIVLMIGTGCAVFVLLFFILTAPTLLQMSRSPLFNDFDSVPEDCLALPSRGVISAVLALLPIIMLLGGVLLYLFYHHSPPHRKQFVLAEMQRAAGLETKGAVLQLLPSFAELFVVQVLDKTLLLYAYRTVLVLTQALHQLLPPLVALPLIFTGSYCFGLSCFTVLYCASQYLLIATYSLAGLFHCHFVRSVLALLLFRCVVWRAAYPRSGYRSVFPVVCRSQWALLRAVQRVSAQDVDTKQEYAEPLDTEQQPAGGSTEDNHTGNPRQLPALPELSPDGLATMNEDLRACSTKAFLRAYYLAKTGAESEKLADEDAQAIFEKLLCDVQRQLLDWIQEAATSTLIAVVIFLLLDDPLRFAFDPERFTALQKIALLLAIWIVFLLQSSATGGGDTSQEDDLPLLTATHRFLVEEILALRATRQAQRQQGGADTLPSSEANSSSDLMSLPGHTPVRSTTPSVALSRHTQPINTLRSRPRRGMRGLRPM